MLKDMYSTVKSNFKLHMNHPIVFAGLSLVLTMYGPRLIDNLPPNVFRLFNNVFFRSFIALLIVYLTTKNIVLALGVAIVFCLYISYLHVSEVKEMFENLQKSTQGTCRSVKQDSDDKVTDAHVASEPEVESESEEYSVQGYSPVGLGRFQDVSNDSPLEACGDPIPEIMKRTVLETTLRNKVTASRVCDKLAHKAGDDNTYVEEEDMEKLIPDMPLPQVSEEDDRNGFAPEPMDHSVECNKHYLSQVQSNISKHVQKYAQM